MTTKEREMTTELKNCPFCGGEPIEDRIEPHKHEIFPGIADYPGSWSIECVKCEFRLFDHDSRENVITAWNKRAESEPSKAEPVAIPEDVREKAINAILWFYRRAKPSYGRLPFAEEAIAALKNSAAPPSAQTVAQEREALFYDAEHALKRGAEYPYHDQAPKDWAERAACGVLYDLGDRAGIKHGFDDVDSDIREEIVAALAAIVRRAALAAPAQLSEEQKDAIYKAWRDQGDDVSYGDLIDAVERALLSAAQGKESGNV